ncbi:MAG: hypothetical protein HYV03_05985 [Deltaproteobacteria bacterium]|nr:hypothetical protein [Deltaproteobacteria bacterium]
MNRFLPWLYAVLIAQHLPALFVPIITKDEGYWWTIGNAVARGGLLYRDAADNKPPIFFAIYAAAVGLFGTGAMAALHLLVTVGNGFILYILHRLARRAYGEAVGIGVACCYLTLQGAFIAQELLAANSENLMMPWLVAALACYVAAQQRPAWWRYLACGICIGVAAGIRQTGIAMLGLVWLHTALARRPWRQATAEALLAGSGTAIVWIAIGAYFAWRGTLADLWFWNVTLNRAYVGEPVPLTAIIWEGTWKTGAIVAAGGLVWWMALAAFGHARSLWREGSVWVLFFLTMVGTVCVGWRFSHHYYIQLFPALALLAGWAMAWHRRAGRSCWPMPWRLSLLCLAVPFFGFMAEGYYRWHQEVRGGPRPKVRAVATWLREHSTPSDTLFLWGYYPEIHYYSGLANASRHIESHIVTGQLREVHVTAALGDVTTRLWDWLDSDFAAHPPTWIADTSSYPVSGRLLPPTERYPRIAALIAAHYERIATIHGMPIYHRTSPRSLSEK